ncbi:uncharacterized protein [Dermacentor albipictus]|uniref:uncharacterized protein isoform X2 n=1 Tax=Dermacentor albipictus TaxID=60249 RepID=UPI0031FBEEA9
MGRPGLEITGSLTGAHRGPRDVLCTRPPTISPSIVAFTHSGPSSKLPMARANVPRFLLVQFLGLWRSQLLQPCSIRAPCPESVARLTTGAKHPVCGRIAVEPMGRPGLQITGSLTGAHRGPRDVLCTRPPTISASIVAFTHSGPSSKLPMPRANVARFLLVQFLGLWRSQLLQPCSIRAPCPESVARLTTGAKHPVCGRIAVEPMGRPGLQITGSLTGAHRGPRDVLCTRPPTISASIVAFTHSGPSSKLPMPRANVARFLLVQGSGDQTRLGRISWHATPVKTFRPNGRGFRTLELAASGALSFRAPCPESVARLSPGAELPVYGRIAVEPVGPSWTSDHRLTDSRSRSAHFVHGRRLYLQVSWHSLSLLNTGAPPVHSAHAWNSVKTQRPISAPLSGYGSKPAMTRANVPRFLLVKESLNSASIPHDWQEGKVITVFKKGSRGHHRVTAALLP